MLMEKVKDLERVISNLTPKEYKEFREWFEKYEAEQWDKQFEKDVKGGKLDTIAEEATQEYEKGNCSEL